MPCLRQSLARRSMTCVLLSSSGQDRNDRSRKSASKASKKPAPKAPLNNNGNASIAKSKPKTQSKPASPRKPVSAALRPAKTSPRPRKGEVLVEDDEEEEEDWDDEWEDMDQESLDKLIFAGVNFDTDAYETASLDPPTPPSLSTAESAALERLVLSYDLTQAVATATREAVVGGRFPADMQLIEERLDMMTHHVKAPGDIADRLQLLAAALQLPLMDAVGACLAAPPLLGVDSEEVKMRLQRFAKLVDLPPRAAAELAAHNPATLAVDSNALLAKMTAMKNSTGWSMDHVATMMRPYMFPELKM